MHTFQITMLLNGGAEYELSVYAANEAEAVQAAMQEATERCLQPAEALHVRIEANGVSPMA